ncbi:MAG: signal peptidase I [Clostridiales bacterium]|nr:signal peptidase I [Clostridiales bacterium]
MRELLELLCCLALALLLRLYVVSFMRVRGSSMRSTLHNGDFGLVWRLPYLLGKPRRGDVVICHYPGRRMRRIKWLPQAFVKRVIGLPGETVEIIEGVVHIDGAPLQEPYLDPDCCRYARSSPARILDKDEYFVLGDNRDHSNDSRYVGPIRRRAVRGRVVCILWPLRHGRRVR